MQQKKIYLGIGIVLGVLGIVLLTVYLKVEKAKMAEDLKNAFREERKNLESIVVAVSNIARGKTITSEMVGTEIVSRRYIPSNAVKSVKEIIGKKTSIAISKGEHVTFNKLAVFRGGKERTLATVVPVGKRGITIKVNEISSMAGMIKAGDYVDVIVLFPSPMRNVDGKRVTQMITLPLFQNVLVLAVGRQMQEQGSQDEQGGLLGVFTTKESKKEKVDSAISSLVTLALPPQEASYLSFVSEQGKIRLVLRSPADAKVKPVFAASWDSLFQYIGSLYPVRSQKKEEILKKPPRKVEIYRGFNKSYMAVSE